MKGSAGEREVPYYYDTGRALVYRPTTVVSPSAQNRTEAELSIPIVRTTIQTFAVHDIGPLGLQACSRLIGLSTAALRL